MKKTLFFLFVFAVLFSPLLQAKASFIEVFYGRPPIANNVEVLKNFLYQSDGTSTNYKILGLSDQEMSEGSAWLDQLIIHGIIDLNAENEVIKLELNNYKVIGDLDISTFTALQKLEITKTDLVNLNFSNALLLHSPIIGFNSKLKSLTATNTSLRRIELDNSKELEYIDFSDSKDFLKEDGSPTYAIITIKNLPQLKKINLSGFYSLENVALINLKNLVHVDLSNVRNIGNYDGIVHSADPTYIIKNTNLEYLNVYSNSCMIEHLDIINAGNLRTIEHSNINFSLSGRLTIAGIKSDTFELKNNIDLTFGSFSFENNHNIKSLDLTTLITENLYVENNHQLSELKFGVHEASFLKNNKLTFKDLPKPGKYYPYEYAPQQKTIGKDVAVGEELDLSVNNCLGMYDPYDTQFNWYDGEEKIAVNVLRQGIFSFDEKLSGKTLTCKMTHGDYSGLTLEYEVKVIASLSVIEEEVKNQKSVRVYPNPTSDLLNILSKETIYSLEVYSTTGNLIQKHDEINALKKELSVQGWTVGIYIIKLKTKKGTKSIRFYKK